MAARDWRLLNVMRFARRFERKRPRTLRGRRPPPVVAPEADDPVTPEKTEESAAAALLAVFDKVCVTEGPEAPDDILYFYQRFYGSLQLFHTLQIIDPSEVYEKIAGSPRRSFRSPLQIRIEPAAIVRNLYFL